MTRPAISYLSLIAAASFAPVVAMAQTAPSQPDQGQTVALENVVLSANRTAMEANRTGASVSVITEDDLARAGDQQLSEYLARLPGLGMVQNGPLGTKSDIRIRGAAGAMIAVYVDGVRVDDPTGIQVALDFGALTTADVGRIEVLRGSQSALWGSAAVGGVINITSRTAMKDGFSQSVALEAGSSNSRSARYALGFKDARLQASLNLTHLRTDGFSAYDQVPRLKDAERDGTEIARLSFGARYQLTETLAIGGNIFTQKTNGDLDDWGADNATNTHIRRETGARVFAEFETGATSHLIDVTRYRISRDIRDSWPSQFEGRRTGLSYQGTTAINPAFTLVYGADTSKEEASYSIMPRGTSSRISGVYVQGIYQPRDDLDISVTARQDHNSTFGNHTSGRLAVAWQASPDFTLRGVASTGYRAPSIYEQFGDVGLGIGPNADVTPEKSRSYEIGADYRLGNGARISGTLFQVSTDNALTYCGAWSVACQGTLLPGFSNMYENVAGTTRRRGLELEAAMPISAYADLGLAYTYIDTRTPSGDRLARVPRHDVTLSLSGDLSDQLSANASVTMVSGRWDFPTDQDSYTVVNAGMSYALTPETSASLRVENLFDEDYQTVPGYGTKGRAVYVGLRHNF